MTPKAYYPSPAPLERLRCALVRGALSGLLSLVWLLATLLPRNHPVRVFLSGRIPQLREELLPALVPASHPHAAALATCRRLWMASLLLLVAAVIGDLSAHIFSLPLLSREREGLLLLLVWATAIYAMRPARWQITPN